jgi:hypothetical protein
MHAELLSVVVPLGRVFEIGAGLGLRLPDLMTATHHDSRGLEELPMFGSVLRISKELIVNPGRVMRRHHRTLASYKALCDLMLAGKRQRLRTLSSTLPPPPDDLRVPVEDGFKLVAPGRLASAVSLVGRCRGLINQRADRLEKKAQLSELISVDEVGQFAEFLNFCLDPTILAVGAHYLGELPILASVQFWRSRATGDTYQNSQLYHSDLDDFKQFKVFLFVSDVDMESGPLTLLPAHVSERIARALRYRPASGKVRLLDDQIRPLISPGDERVLTGPSGTLVFMDTSRALHFGSRVSSRDRYVVMLQYLTLTNFMRNPFYSFAKWPYAHLAQPSFTPVQRAVLGDGVVRTLGRVKR